MRFILFALILDVFGSVVDERSKRHRRQQINLYELYPAGVTAVQTNQKYQLTYGVPSPGIFGRIESLEAQPVVSKIHRLRDLLKISGSMRIYPTLDFSTPYVDVRLLSLLIRIAVNKRNKDEFSIESACDIIAFLKQKYPQVDFDYLTPQYVLDAYYILGRQRLSLTGNRAIIFGDLQTSEQCLLLISPAAWHDHIIRPRLNRVLLTGYEDIQLL